MVLAVSDVALEFALRYRGELFPTAPIVASVARAPEASIRDAGAGLTGIVSGVSYDKTLELALRLHPSTTRVFVVAHTPAMRIADSVEKELRAFSARVELTYLEEPSVDRLLASIRSVPAGSIILYVRHSKEDVARLVAEASRVPVYGVSDCLWYRRGRWCRGVEGE